MEDFRKLFYEEAQDLLSNLEESLLILEDDPKNKELINEVFRIMHSLKGSGAMFGFKTLSSFTHELENLYDQIRNDKLELSTAIISFTMNAIDHIKELLEDDSSTESISKTDEQKTQLNKLLQNDGNQVGEVIEKEEHNDPVLIEKDGQENKIYYIYFEPDEDILNDGTNPLYLIDEIADLGHTITSINYSKIPEFRLINPLKTYLSWTIILSTDASLSEINDIFIFVEDTCKIVVELISDKDLFSINNAKTTFEYLLKNKPDDIDGLKKIAITLESEINQNNNISVIEDLKELEIKDESKKSNKSNAKTDNVPINKEVKLPEALNIETVKVSSKKLDTLINLVSELVTTQARLVTISNNTKLLELTGLSEDFQHLSRQFRDIAFDMRLIPIQTMFGRYKRLIRDLSASLNKKINFITEGTETELDKNIIATISDPIMHIIRNAVDHGIETPEERLRNGKSEEGTIYLKAEYSGTSILITVKDDGAGINTDKVLEKAIVKNLVKAGTKLTTKEIHNILLLPGFSTSDTVSDVSGRGVGMDVVQKNINELRGEININSKPGEGTQILIRLPLTLSIIDGLLISINNDKFVIPLSSVKQIYQVSREDIENSYNKVIKIEGQQFPFIDLTQEFDTGEFSNDILHFITVSYYEKNSRVNY